MKASTAAILGWGLLAIALFGCEAPELSQSASSASTPAAAPAPAAAEQPAEELGPGGRPLPPLPEDETPVTDVPRKFDAHDPIKGRRSRDVGGYMGATAAAKFYAEHQMKILSIDHANQLYWGEHGDWPKSHEEFMKNIIEFNKIALPEIPDDEEYIYVPEQGDIGLQIRLKPGSPRSSLPAPAAGEEHVYHPPAEAAVAAEPAAPEPSPNIRTRAEQLGDRANSRTEDHGLAPGGLVPVGGLE